MVELCRVRGFCGGVLRNTWVCKELRQDCQADSQPDGLSQSPLTEWEVAEAVHHHQDHSTHQDVKRLFIVETVFAAEQAIAVDREQE